MEADTQKFLSELFTEEEREQDSPHQEFEVDDPFLSTEDNHDQEEDRTGIE